MHILQFLLPLALSSQIVNALPQRSQQIPPAVPALDRRTSRTAFSLVTARLRMFRTNAGFAGPCWDVDANGKQIMVPCSEDACQIHSQHRDLLQLDCVYYSVEMCHWFKLEGPECDKEDNIAEVCPQTDEQFIDKLMKETGYSREETARKWYRIMEFTELGYGGEDGDFTCPEGAIDPIFHYNETAPAVPKPVAAPVQAPAVSSTTTSTTSTKPSPKPSPAPEQAAPVPVKPSITTTTTSSSTSTPSPSPKPSKGNTESPHLVDPVHGPGYGLDQNGQPRRAGRPCFWNSGCSLLQN